MSKTIAKKKRLATRTFRLDEGIDRVLEAEANRQYLSVNALVNKVLIRYKDFGRFAERHEALHFFYNDWKAFLERLTPTDLQELGKRLGDSSPQAVLSLVGMDVDAERLPYFIEEVMSRYQRWFKAEKLELEDRVRYSLRHDLGTGWSIFLKSFLDNMLKHLFKVRAEVDLVEDVVVCTIWK